VRLKRSGAASAQIKSANAPSIHDPDHATRSQRLTRISIGRGEQHGVAPEPESAAADRGIDFPYYSRQHCSRMFTIIIVVVLGVFGYVLRRNFRRFWMCCAPEMRIPTGRSWEATITSRIGKEGFGSFRLQRKKRERRSKKNVKCQR
jgi:hypothetical protein